MAPKGAFLLPKGLLQMATSSKKQADTVKKIPPNAGKGRKKGALNKTTKAAKDAIAEAADALGGAVRLVEWAKEDPANERVFWGTIYPKLLPLQVSGEGGGALVVEITRFADAK